MACTWIPFKRPNLLTIHLLSSLILVSCKVPKIVEIIPRVTVSVGNDITLQCTVENLGRYKVAWLHVDKHAVLSIQTHVISHNSRYTAADQGKRKWMLHIRDVTEEDRGYYMCQINTVPMRSDVTYLYVVVPPKFIDENTSGDMTVTENTNVTLMCQASGFPHPKIKWRRQDGQEIDFNNKEVSTVDGSSLTLHPVKRSHMGAYLCIASNGIPPSVSRVINLNVTFSPMIWIPKQMIGVQIGSDVVLECFTQAHPAAVNMWVRDDDVMIVSSDKYENLLMESSFKVHMKLRIFDVQKEDFGSYTCKAKNVLGETKSSIKIFEAKGSLTTGKPGISGGWISKDSDEMIYSESFSDSHKDNLYPPVEPNRGNKKPDSIPECET